MTTQRVRAELDRVGDRLSPSRRLALVALAERQAVSQRDAALRATMVSLVDNPTTTTSAIAEDKAVSGAIRSAPVQEARRQLREREAAVVTQRSARTVAEQQHQAAQTAVADQRTVVEDKRKAAYRANTPECVAADRRIATLTTDLTAMETRLTQAQADAAALTAGTSERRAADKKVRSLEGQVARIQRQIGDEQVVLAPRERARHEHELAKTELEARAEAEKEARKELRTADKTLASAQRQQRGAEREFDGSFAEYAEEAKKGNARYIVEKDLFKRANPAYMLAERTLGQLGLLRAPQLASRLPAADLGRSVWRSRTPSTPLETLDLGGISVDVVRSPGFLTTAGEALLGQTPSMPLTERLFPFVEMAEEYSSGRRALDQMPNIPRRRRSSDPALTPIERERLQQEERTRRWQQLSTETYDV